MVSLADANIAPYMLAEFNKSKVTNLSFRHFETAYSEKASYSRDLESVHELYNHLFSADQKQVVISKGLLKSRASLNKKVVRDVVK
jgi:hypothetical protein